MLNLGGRRMQNYPKKQKDYPEKYKMNERIQVQRGKERGEFQVKRDI